jgi:hypothetical protein
MFALELEWSTAKKQDLIKKEKSMNNALATTNITGNVA